MEDTDWYPIQEDDDPCTDVITFEYTDHFDYMDFVDRVTPLIQEILESDIFDHCIEDDLCYDMCDADYTSEIEDMFVRMGLKRLDGTCPEYLSIPFSYVEVIIQRDTKYGAVYDRLPLDVDCILEIARL